MKDDTSRSRTVPLWVLIVVLLAAGPVLFGLGWLLAPQPAQPASEDDTTWGCAMDPGVQLPSPGKCPICGMDLIPTGGGSDPGPRALEVSEAAMKLADIETVVAEHRFVETEVRMVGKIDFDETRVKTITAWVSGRLERLYVDYTGVPVKKGEHLVEIYSPAVFAAQQELIEARRAVDALTDSDSTYMRESTRGMLAAVREKFRLWGLSTEQVEAIEERQAPSDRVLIHAPSGGVVIEKLANEGDYVDTGTPIYKVADLSRLWVRLDAYESDLTWLRYGQNVEFHTAAYPGELFEGQIAFIDPILDERTRTVKVRVNVANEAGRLKPGMFVRAIVRARVHGGGRVLDPALAGKWLCPMHPDVVSDSAGSCTVCGMDLVPAAELFATQGHEIHPPLVIPASAPLITGKRAIVYVKLPDRDKPTFEGREVVLGPRAGDHYVVLSGLAAGDEVVVRGNFKIDSALQIQAKPSMMSAEGGGGAAETRPESRPQTRPETGGKKGEGR